MESETQRHFSSLGRGLVQVNLRLTRLTEILEGAGPVGAAAATGSMDLVLDLLDAVERTTAQALAPAPRPPWFHRVLRLRPSAVPDLTGLVLARDHALHQLARAGLTRIPTEGPVNPDLHQVLDARETDDPARVGTVATTHRPGWYRAGEPPVVVRFAQVTAWRLRVTP